MRIAAAGDVHCRDGDEQRVRALFGDVASRADVLVLCGDLTDHGRLREAESLARGLEAVDVPVLAVLGNHDHESRSASTVADILHKHGVTILERDTYVREGVGFAGAKGFCGGFDRRIVRPFGEDVLKEFIHESVREADALRERLRSLPSNHRVAVTHYAPVAGTLSGEPPELHAFLGTSLLAQALEDGAATIALHGHAHRGAFESRTPGGIPVHNVSLPVLERSGHDEPYWVFET